MGAGSNKGELRHSFEGTFYGKVPVEKETGDAVCDIAKSVRFTACDVPVGTAFL
jgi:hypothetical protein